MNATVSDKVKGQITLTIEIPVDETEGYLKRAADRLSQKTSIPGFRPGKAPANVIKQRYGDMALYEEALQDIVTQTLWVALKEHKIDSVGQPQINVEKMAPDNPIVYKAIVSVLPEVKLNNWQDVHAKRKDIVITDAEVDEMIDNLRGMQATEALVKRAAQNGDKVEVNFEVKHNGAIIEGGKGTKYPLILGKGTMIPGFEEEILGATAGASKEFMLTFPSPYFQESLAGKQATFKVELLGVYERNLPEKNDEWARSMMGRSYPELVTLLKENLKSEKEQKEKNRLEQEIIEAIIKGATFTDVPENMVHSETSKMMYELEDDVKHRGMEWEKYLSSMKKTKEQIEKEFEPQALQRAKAGLALRVLADELKLEATDPEIEKELTQQRESYAGNEEVLKNLTTKEFRRYVAVTLTNRKVIDALIEKLALA
jgi:trigger factor